MKLTQTFSLALLGMFMLAMTPFAAHAADGEHPGWTTDYDAAKAQAKKEGKKLMLKFTGSDWCPPCQYMWKEVFSKSDFNDAALKDYVLVYLDYPRNDYRSAELKKQNAKLQQDYSISGYPTVIVADADGDAIYSTSGAKQGIGPKAYVEWLSKQADTIVTLKADLKKAEPADKMVIMDKALSDSSLELPETMRQQFMDEIIKLDADDKAGLKSKYMVEKNFTTMMAKFNDGTIQNADQALAEIDTFMKNNKAEGEVLQQVLVMKGQVLGSQNDLQGVYDSFKAAMEAAPESEIAQRIKQALPQIKAALDKTNQGS